MITSFITLAPTPKAARRTLEFFTAQVNNDHTGKTTGACPGFMIDHVIALKHGGNDDPANMQWQSKEEARAKDKIE